jgi:hypothetical protein
MKKFSAILLIVRRRMKFFKILPLLSALLLMITCNSYAISMDELSFNQDYWSITDFTTNQTGTALFQIQLEQAAYESNFGLYYVDDINNPTSPTTFQIFDKTEEESYAFKTISFLNIGSDWWVTDNYTVDSEGSDTTDWIAFSNIFGFYYEVYTGGEQDPDIDYTWYTDLSLNEDGVEHVGTVYHEYAESVHIYLDDQYGGGDRDFTDMTVFADDVAPAPVPEPATMLLLGTGLIGLAGISRKKMFRK